MGKSPQRVVANLLADHKTSLSEGWRTFTAAASCRFLKVNPLNWIWVVRGAVEQRFGTRRKFTAWR